MRLRITRGPARAAALVAIATRAFLSNAVDTSITHNGAWLCPLIAAALMLPWLLCTEALRNGIDKHRGANTLVSVVLLPVLLLELGASLATVARSAGYLALDRVSIRLLALPVCLALAWCLCRNGDAVGYAAMVFVRVFVALMLLIVLIQARCYRPLWLRPVLGAGPRAILEGGVRTAGRAIPCAAVLLIAEKGDEPPEHRFATVRMLVLSAVIASVLLVFYNMMIPTSVYNADWIESIDGLLTNGRAPIYLQLPMIVAWYAGLMHLLLCEGFACAALLQRLIPCLDGKLCAVCTAVAAGLLAVSSLPSATFELAASLLYAVLTAVIALAAVVAKFEKGGIDTCAPRDLRHG